ncbi:MAG: DNA internalization-related competence protein ComEC/Rec2 [Burkholderiales bacterium]|nr:DNA internalization-related competence protein ComEC/Rec2 [Burkholderiales bacterium]
MAPHIIAFAAGVWLLQQQAGLPELRWAWLLLPAVSLAVLLRGGGVPRGFGRGAVMLACAAAAGFFWAAACAHWRLADHLPPEWESRDIMIAGVVSGLPQAYDRSVRFEFDVERVLTPEAIVPERIALSWWGRGARDGGSVQLPEVHAGERWELTVRLKRPHGLANPHGFDYEAWLLERGIRATGYVRPKTQTRRLDAAASGFAYRLETLRERLRGRIRSTLGDAPAAGIVIALAMGDQRAIPPAQWQTFTRTGVNHLMSISGLHVTMLSGLAFALVNLLWRRSARLTLALPAVKAAAAIGFAIALAYALIAGFAVPAQRTVFMLAVVAMALWSGRIAAAGPVLALALFAVLVIDPWAVNAPGFWLSFGAVAVILWVSVNRLRQPHWLVTWGRVQWAVTLALIPPLLAMFQQVSLVSPLANALAIPLVSFVVVPPALAGMLLPFDAPLHFAQWVMAVCLQLLEWLGRWPEAAWQQHAPPAWTVVAALAGTVWLLLPRGFPSRWIGALAFLPLFLIVPAPPPGGALRLTVLDVGQGLAVVAQTRNHALLFDTGPAFGPGADSGSRVIVPFLRAAGIHRLDAMVVSHDDADHTGGALSVLQAVPVDTLLTSLPDLDPLLLIGPEERRCMAGQSWQWDGARFEMLYPDAATRDAEKLKDNERSCVLKITTVAGSVLIPADIERLGERTLLATVPEKLKSDVLVAPHQGSRTSSSQAFVEAVAPRLVIFPVGYRNPFRHPHPDVVARYEALGSARVRTDEGGAIAVELREGRPLTVTRHRDRYVRYWHAPREGGTVEPLLPLSGDF